MSTYKIAVVGDKDSILGFKTLGVDTFPVATAGEALSVLRKLSGQTYGVISVSYTHLDVYKRQWPLCR